MGNDDDMDPTLRSILREKELKKMSKEIGFHDLTAEMIEQHNPTLFEAIKAGDVSGGYITEAATKIEDLSPAAIYRLRPDLYSQISRSHDNGNEGDLKEQVVEAARARPFYGNLLEREKEKATQSDNGQKTTAELVLEAARTRRF